MAHRANRPGAAAPREHAGRTGPAGRGLARELGAANPRERANPFGGPGLAREARSRGPVDRRLPGPGAAHGRRRTTGPGGGIPEDGSRGTGPGRRVHDDGSRTTDLSTPCPGRAGPRATGRGAGDRAIGRPGVGRSGPRTIGRRTGRPRGGAVPGRCGSGGAVVDAARRGAASRSRPGHPIVGRPWRLNGSPVARLLTVPGWNPPHTPGPMPPGPTAPPARRVTAPPGPP